MVTLKFSATKSDTLFLAPTIAVEQSSSETAIRFALWHGVFSIEVERAIKMKNSAANGVSDEAKCD